MRRVKITADTQLAIGVPIKIYKARLVHTGATTADFYNEADSSKTAGAKQIALATSASVLTDQDGPVVFETGCYIDYLAGELWIDID
jgi:hypothetical protein